MRYVFKTIIKCTIDQLNSRFGDLHYNNFFTIATYLDPRYKTKFFNEVVKEKLESTLISLLHDDGNKSAHEEENIDVPVEKRARLASPIAGTSSNVKNNVQTILSNI